ncbi:triacylglycerol lipase [Parafrankia sp. EUN1f]|uniref:esterase/lipase family protein n=1 Tax=Parafrankia sp. EUN1f TaxID=102897 RepID=UPI0001C44DD6|nr:triacylglycerol lipase [Parafrankia sp. EUN1f]EFC84707.1 lipase class 2 [Parafrankia sp. EUN1f]
MFRAARILGALAVAFTALLGTSTSASAATHDPVIFVYGFNGSTSTWTDMVADFQAHGYSVSELTIFTYTSTQSNVTTANQLASKVAAVRSATGAAKVDLVTHSMGALSSRYFLKNLGGTSVVDDWVSLGGPNHGTTTASLCSWLFTACSDMVPGSSFLNALNATDETPGSVNYGTWWSSCDDTINPDSSVALNGATNTAAGCLGHSELHDDDTVAAGVRAFIG